MTAENDSAIRKKLSTKFRANQLPRSLPNALHPSTPLEDFEPMTIKGGRSGACDEMITRTDEGSWEFTYPGGTLTRSTSAASSCGRKSARSRCFAKPATTKIALAGITARVASVKSTEPHPGLEVLCSPVILATTPAGKLSERRPSGHCSNGRERRRATQGMPGHTCPLALLLARTQLI